MSKDRVNSEPCRRFRKIAGVAAMLGVGAMLAGCAGTDVQIDAPILQAAGINLTSKPPAEPNLQDRPPLVVPPKADKLPEPGQKTAALNKQAWPDDPDLKAKKKAEVEKEEQDRYCREGDWSGEGNIDEFEKTTGRQQRCPSKVGKALSKSLGGGNRPSDD